MFEYQAVAFWRPQERERWRPHMVSVLTARAVTFMPTEWVLRKHPSSCRLCDLGWVFFDDGGTKRFAPNDLSDPLMICKCIRHGLPIQVSLFLAGLFPFHLTLPNQTSLSLFTFTHWRRKWQPTPVFLPGESQGRRSLVGCRLWGCTESDTTEVT